jgi:putative Holliday junction resolvase
MRVISVDLGLARTGIATGDDILKLASPVTVINEYNEEKLVDKICICASEQGAKKIVVGLPKNMDGTEGPRAELCRSFAGGVEALTDLPVALWDERRTTVEAHNILSEHNYHGKKRKNTVDAVAASLILEGYLNSIK